MRSSVLLLFLACGLTLKGQNLVPNPSFENYQRLPCTLNEFLVQHILENWQQPIITTTDYWNNLSAANCILNSSNTDVAPRTGQGVIGMITADIFMGLNTEYKEYVEVELTEKLKASTLYNVEFYAASQSKKLFEIAQVLETNNLGVAFSNNLISDFSSTSPNHLLLKSFVKAEDIISANNSWQKIGGCFNSDSAYQYLLIGNFDSIDSTKTRDVTSYMDLALGYYFVDDVSVEKLPYDVSRLSNGTTLCSGQDFVELNAFVDGATGYHWQDGSQASSFEVSTQATKDYTVEISFNECSYKHKFHVTYIPDVFLGADTTLCSGEVLKLAPTHPINEYLWSDGSSDAVKIISGPGVYAVTVPSNDCAVQDSIDVKFLECPGFVPNIVTPNEDPYNEYFVFENIENRIWSLEIFNRWGEQVYFSAHYENNWSGAELSAGIYYYKLVSKALNKELRGWVNVTY